MSLLSYFKGNTNPALSGVERRVSELVKYSGEIEAELRLDWHRRVYGDGVYSGYKTLRDFYKGQQWSYLKEGGGTMRTYNYVFTIVENLTAFLTNEPPQMTCPPRRLDDRVERAIAEGKTKLIDTIHEANDLPLVFQRAVRVGSTIGDSMIFGPIPVYDTKEDGSKYFKGIRYWNVERPETIRIIWKDENYTEFSGFVKHYRISVAVAKKLFAKQIRESGLHVQEDYDTELTTETQKTGVPMMTVKELWLEDEYLLLFNNDSKPVEYVKHDWGFVPLHYVPNIHLPGESKGTSDIEHELDPQQEYNERASDLGDIIKELAQPTYWGKNVDEVTEVRSGQTVIYSVGDDAEINAMPKSGSTAPLDSYINDRKNDMIALSGLNQVLYPGSQVLQATGRALSVVMQGVNNKISLRKEWWIKAFKDINSQILFHAENHITGAKLLIGGHYKTDVFISSVLLRSVTDEINKFNSKLQSQTTTMKNIGVSNPSEEQKLMKEELEDPILATEIAKQPQLLQQVLQTIAAQQQGANVQNGGVPGIAGPSENSEGSQPAPVPGVASPVSASGAVKQKASRTGAATQISRK